MKTNNFSKLLLAGVAGFLSLSSCHQQEDKSKIYAANDIIFKDIDTTVKSGDDFFQYANGAWLKKHPIPAAYSSWGIGRVVQEELRDRLKKINEDALKENAAKGTSSQKIGDFYYSGMDTLNIEKQGLSPLKAELDKIDQVKDLNGLLAEFAHLQTIGVTTPIGADVEQDAKNSSKMVLQLGQTGIGLPNRDYYFNTDQHSTDIRNDYQQKHLPTVFKLAGMNDAAAAQA